MSSEIITKNDLKAILDEILPSCAVDYVVEQGTSGIWTYRKWNSGTAECWGTSNVASSSYTANGGYKQVTESMPSGLFNVTPNSVTASGNIVGTAQTMMGYTYASSATTVQTYLVNRSGSAVTATGIVYWAIKGTWK